MPGRDTSDKTPTEVRFYGGPLDGGTRRITREAAMQDIIIAYRHRQAGVIEIGEPKYGGRQPTQWEQFPYALSGPEHWRIGRLHES